MKSVRAKRTDPTLIVKNPLNMTFLRPNFSREFPIKGDNNSPATSVKTMINATSVVPNDLCFPYI